MYYFFQVLYCIHGSPEKLTGTFSVFMSVYLPTNHLNDLGKVKKCNFTLVRLQMDVWDLKKRIQIGKK